MTYAMITGRQVKAVAIYIECEPNKGKRSFDVGYAVAAPFRGQGLAKAVVTSTLEEFTLMTSPQLSEPGFYLEAVVGVDNERSQSVARQLINQTYTEIVDSASGQTALHYITYVP